MDFSKFDKEVNIEQLQKDIASAAENVQEYAETPNGTYVGKVEKLEVGETKDHRPVLKLQFRITEGEYTNKCLFFNNLVLYGTKNDGNMIASTIGFLDTLESGIDVTFESYSQFADLVLDIFEAIENTTLYEVEYDKDVFQKISILDVFDA